MATHTIKIIYEPKGNLLFEKHPHKVRPGHLYVSLDDKVTFSSKKTKITIFLPEPTRQLLGTLDNLITLEATQSSDTFIIQKIGNKEEGSEGRRFPYAVYCEAGNDFAEGGSAPQMIVE